jgi:ABC-type multidrug transport system fused ATPase/permease subunit
VRHADQIAVLENGCLCEQGGWDELVEQGGRFHELLLAAEASSAGR